MVVVLCSDWMGISLWDYDRCLEQKYLYMLDEDRSGVKYTDFESSFFTDAFESSVLS